MEFEDERGLIRRATLAFGSRRARHEAFSVLRLIGHVG
jgi:hypothetical protein